MSGLKLSPEQIEKLQRFNGIASNVWSIDNILRVISYSGLLGAQVLTSQNGGKPTEFAEFLLTLFSKVTDARFINRVGGFPATLEAFFSDNGVDKSIHSILGRIMTWSMMIYYPLEHLWLLSTFKPKVINIDSDKWSMWSCRAWSIYVICDIIGTVLRIKEVSRRIEKLDKNDQSVKELEERKRREYIWSTCAFSDLVMALHWSVENGPVSTNQICAVGIYGGLASLYLKWIKNAKK